ncbi:MAG: HAD family phosphatase [Pseudomonadota bacterium]
MTFDLVIFDCDGTLVDTEYANNLATIELLHEQNLTQYDMAHAMENFVGKRFNVILNDITEETGNTFPDDMSARYIKRATDLLPTHIKTIAGAEELVRAAQQNTKICVGSNGQRDNVIYSLELAGLKDYFPDEHIFTGLDVPNPKPAPDLFLLAARKMGAKPAKCLVIEDSQGGATAGIAAGITTYGFVGVSHEPKTMRKTLLESVGVDAVFDDLIHIKEKHFA